MQLPSYTTKIELQVTSQNRVTHSDFEIIFFTSCSAQADPTVHRVVDPSVRRGARYARLATGGVVKVGSFGA